MKAIRNEWSRRVKAEYCSAAVGAELLHWLIQMGASPDLIYRCNQIITDEMMHSDLSRNVYDKAGGEELQFQMNDLEGFRIQLDPKIPLIDRISLFVADMFCCGETIAVDLFSAMRVNASQKNVTKTLDRIIRDEKKHSEFGWLTIEWLITNFPSHPFEPLRTTVPEMVKTRVENYQSDTQVSDLQKGWGLLSGAEYCSISTRVAEKKINPRFKDILG